MAAPRFCAGFTASAVAVRAGDVIIGASTGLEPRGTRMAEQEGDIPETDQAAHADTYSAFVAGTKYAIVSIAVVLILMAVFL
jgi:hypothetical protein